MAAGLHIFRRERVHRVRDAAPKSTTNTATTPQVEINLLSIPDSLRYALNVGEGSFCELRAEGVLRSSGAGRSG